LLAASEIRLDGEWVVFLGETKSAQFFIEMYENRASLRKEALFVFINL
jgi:hypothetical protein